MKIDISMRSQELLNEYSRVCGSEFLVDLSVDRELLISWLNAKYKKIRKKNKEQKALFLSLRASLLHDLASSMNVDQDIPLRQQEKSIGTEKIKFILITTAGILVAACQGFDGMVTMLSIFSVSPAILLGAGLVFSLLSVAAFCGFDLVKVSNRLGVKLGLASKLLDALLLQLKEIKVIRKIIENYCLTELSPEELKQIGEITSTLQGCLRDLVRFSKQFEDAIKSDVIQISKWIISGISGLLFFGSGFFAGQSVALFVASLIINSAISAFWPVIIFSTLVGLAALGLYWFVERPGLNKLVSSWFGLDEDEVSQLTDRDLLRKEEKKLRRLNANVHGMMQVAGTVVSLDHNSHLDEKVDEEDSVQYRNTGTNRTSTNYYSFLKPSQSNDSANDAHETDLYLSGYV